MDILDVESGQIERISHFALSVRSPFSRIMAALMPLRGSDGRGSIPYCANFPGEIVIKLHFVAAASL